MVTVAEFSRFHLWPARSDQAAAGTSGFAQINLGRAQRKRVSQLSFERLGVFGNFGQRQ